MSVRKPAIRSDLRKVDRHVVTEEELAEIPELTDELVERMVPHLGGKPVNRGGRPRSVSPKQAVSIRLSPEVLAYFRRDQPGWQTRIDAALREVARRGGKGEPRRKTG